MTKRQRQQLADQLRQAITDSGLTMSDISRETEVHRSQLSRFMRGQRDLGLQVADRLCQFLGLSLTKDAGPASPAGGPAEASPEPLRRVKRRRPEKVAAQEGH
jgi:transcriptional regulator with XRE-family HTH domain